MEKYEEKNTKGNVERLLSPFSLNKGEESLEKVYLPTIYLFFQIFFTFFFLDIFPLRFLSP